ncbi:dickkopf-related protein 2 [Protopterus annectens]|uniref:dickkopf-related protein 2 n=1 Tax=Protopterus annectens TaxID=7888 RepID=UPI001CFB95A5|nr:dickkopf-related protein 2 [Protopterus annectens]
MDFLHTSGSRNFVFLCFLVIALLTGKSSQRTDSPKSKVNSIKSTLVGQSPTQATNRSMGVPQVVSGKKGRHHGQAYPCSSDKECDVGRYCYSPHLGTPSCLNCRRKKKRCHRDGMCCPGTRCSNGMCILLTESNINAHIPTTEIHNKRKHGHGKEKDWQNFDKTPSKTHREKGREGDPCLRSSDCTEGLCCARHFWTKICKPVLRQGEVCTKQRKKGSVGLEIFQRCDCAKGLSCKVWKDATSFSKSRLHVCQKL